MMGCLTWYVRIDSTVEAVVRETWRRVCINTLAAWLESTIAWDISEMVGKGMIDNFDDVAGATAKLNLPPVNPPTELERNAMGRRCGQAEHPTPALNSLEYPAEVHFLAEAAEPSVLRLMNCHDYFTGADYEAANTCLRVEFREREDRFVLRVAPIHGEPRYYDVTRVWRSCYDTDATTRLPLKFGQLHPSCRKLEFPYLGDYSMIRVGRVVDDEQAMDILTAMREIVDGYRGFDSYGIKALGLERGMEQGVGGTGHTIIGGTMHR